MNTGIFGPGVQLILSPNLKKKATRVRHLRTPTLSLKKTHTSIGIVRLTSPCSIYGANVFVMTYRAWPALDPIALVTTYLTDEPQILQKGPPLGAPSLCWSTRGHHSPHGSKMGCGIQFPGHHEVRPTSAHLGVRV